MSVGRRAVEARKAEVLDLPTMAETTRLKPAAEEVNIFLVPSPRGDAAELSINELTSTTAALEKATLVYDKVKEIVDLYYQLIPTAVPYELLS